MLFDHIYLKIIDSPAKMIPATKWLNATTDKIFLLDYDKFSLFRVVQRPGKSGDREFNIHQINSCPISLPTAKQDQDAVRSFALDKSADNYLAIGFTSGRINIFQADIDASIKFIRGEEIREVQKSITNLEWNYFDSNRLCAAYERGRGPDHTVVVYDLNRTLRNSRELPVSIFETNFTEKVFGISWFKEDPNLLLISGTRGIRITDIREHGNFQSTLIVQNPLMGVCSEPTHGYLFACHSRNNIFVYDRRFLTFSPLQEIEACASHKIISKLGWHPKRHFHLSAVAKDSGNFYHFSISANAFHQHNQNAEPTAFHHRQTDARNETPEYSYASQIYSVHGVQKLGSFDWHPLIADRVALMPSASHVGRMAASTLPNAASRDLVILSIRGDICSDISCNGEFAHAAAQQLKIDNRRLMEVDKTRIYRTRLETGYGYGNTLSPLPTLIENSRKAIEEDLYADQDLSFCWQWIWAMYQAADASEVQKAYGTMFVGIKHILKGTKSFSTFKQDEVTFRNRIFVNDRRLKILRMCNWPNYSDRDDCKAKFDELASRRGVHGLTRAAALALFSVQGPLSKEYLIQLNEFVNSREFVDSGQGTEFFASYQKMANIVLNIMQKYDGVRVAEYDTIVGEDYIQDHYLLTIVKFLARRDKGYNKIHNEIFESDIDLQDKLAFAALHMDDEYLSAALNNLSKELILARRPLSVLLIVGLEDQPETHQILHHFLDLTEDIQTATILLIIGNCFRKCLAMQDLTLVGTKPSELLDRAIDLESRVNPRRRSLKCARDYMELLNHWRLWLPKAFLCTFLRPKVQFSDLDARSRIMNTQAVIACTYCGSPIYPSTIEKIENLRTPKIGPYPGRRVGTSSRTRAISCICRKPLPKCIICRKHLGSQVEPGMEEATSKTSVIDHWFVWCSNCNHGGHLAHIRDWFSEYPVCASAGCNCLCLHRDDQLREELYSSSTTNDGQTTAEDL